jgi:hypothetical protein
MERKMENNNLPEPKPVYRRRYRSYFWPIILISIGVLLLLSNMGIVPWTTWNLIWRFWPLVLVAVGIDVLFGQRSMFGAIISAFLILALIGAVTGAVFFADQLPIIARYTQDSPWQTSHVEHDLEDYKTAEVFIDWTSQPGFLAATSNSDKLIEGDLTYQGELYFDVKGSGDRADVTLDTRTINNWGIGPFQSNPSASWEVYLTPEIPIDLRLDSGSGSCEFDLAELTLEELFLDSGSGSVNMTLPADQSFKVKMDNGSGSVRIDIPEETGYRVELDSGSGSFNPGSQFELVSGEKGGDGVWESDNYDSAKYKIEMEIDQGSGSITFK